MLKFLFVALAIFGTLINGFQLGAAPRFLSSSRQRQCSLFTVLNTAASSDNNNSNINNDSSSQIEYLTPNQVKTLRKEASKRKARNQLATRVLTEDETEVASLSDSTISALVELIQNNELVQVRGISRNAKRNVKLESERLAVELEHELNDETKPVFLLDFKGHAAIFYSPAGKIQLRNGFREGQWTKKPRPKRDSRGQIIKGEHE